MGTAHAAYVGSVSMYFLACSALAYLTALHAIVGTISRPPVCSSSPSALNVKAESSQLFSGPTNLLGKVKRRTSSHMTCHRTFGQRACHFRSVCWDRHEQTFVYYEEPGQLPLVHTATGNGSDWTIPSDFLRAANEYLLFLPIEKSPFMPLKVAPGPIPADHVFAPEAVHLYFMSHYAENFGHALGDDVLPAFALQAMFGLLTRDVKLLTPRDYAESAGSVGYPAHQRGRRFLHDLFNMISDNPIGELWNDTLYHPLNSEHPTTTVARHTCFTSLLSGHAKLGFLSDNDRYFSALSDYMIATAMTKFPSVHAAATKTPTRQRVLIIKKQGRRAVLNVDDLAEHLRQTFDVQVDVINPAEIETHEQMAQVLSSTLIITPAGGISFICAFVRARTPVIFVGYWSPSDRASAQLDRHVWQPARRFTDLYYDVHFKDITLLPPANLDNPGDNDYMSFGAATVDLARMSRIVASGLLIAERELDLPAHSFSMSQAHTFADRSRL